MTIQTAQLAISHQMKHKKKETRLSVLLMLISRRVTAITKMHM